MTAVISNCGRYRYRLDRHIGSGAQRLVVVMVNPSTADATENDATIRKVIGFARHRGFDHVTVGNLFAFRATDVRELAKVSDPVGPQNDQYLSVMMREATTVLFAWGRLSKLPVHHRDRWRLVDRMARQDGGRPLCLGTGLDGHPRHPLMLSYETPWEAWRP